MHIYIYIIFFMSSRYGVHGVLKNAKAENIFMIFFNAGIGNKHANLNMQCKK
jgi:hypothetical protein